MKTQDFSQFKGELLSVALQKKSLVAATIELTNVCNFKCKHCYLGDSKSCFLDVDIVKRIIDELKELGCIMLLFTGGEPLLHPNFADIYIYAKLKGFIISVYTNGSLINSSHIALFKEYKPYLIEISLYGIDQPSYHSFTEVADSYNKVSDALTSLSENNISFRLKTMLIKHTYPFLSEMKKISQKYNVQFRWDSYIIPTLEGNTNILNDHLLEEDIMCSAILEDDDRRNLIVSKIGVSVNKTKVQKLYICDAGKTNVFISAEAKMSMCVIARDPWFDLNQGSIKDGWSKLYSFSETLMPTDHPCFNCEKIQICRYCPSKFKLETGSINPVKRYCHIADKIIQKL